MELVQVDKGLLEGLLDNIFCVLPDAGIAPSKPKDSLLVTLNQDFKGPMISVFSGRDERLVRPWVPGGKDGWFGSVVHLKPLDQLHAGERREEVFTTAFALAHEVKARPAPNSQNRKWLNFQDETGRKSKVSKLNDVETVEIVEAGEATRNGYEEREAIHTGY